MFNKISSAWRSILYLHVYSVKKWDRHRQYAKRFKFYADRNTPFVQNMKDCGSRTFKAEESCWNWLSHSVRLKLPFFFHGFLRIFLQGLKLQLYLNSSATSPNICHCRRVVLSHNSLLSQHLHRTQHNTVTVMNTLT